MKTQETPTDFYAFNVETLDGLEFDFAALRGKKVMIVNTASKCGLTPQYKELEQLYREFGGDKFVIIGFPANNFLFQEPGTNQQIMEFCDKNYGVTFPMMEKISVKGKDIHPVYEWLTQKQLNGVEDASVSWNFQKFLVDENGNWIKTISPKESPYSEDVINWINN